MSKTGENRGFLHLGRRLGLVGVSQSWGKCKKHERYVKKNTTTTKRWRGGWDEKKGCIKILRGVGGGRGVF
jgi:hypothetical protein